jgi:L-alanine-DL-glutamate epimerase-like enolase superfamily enzyme
MTAPTIAAIETTEFRLPMHGELRWGSQSSLAEARHVLVTVTLRDGSRGVAEAPPRPTIYGETAATVIAIVRDELAPRLIGQPAATAWARMAAIRNNHTAKGAIDMAVHDALAQSAGRSLAEQLGATRDRVRVSYILGIGGRDEVLAEAERVVAQGVRVLKVKVGRDWDEDIARVSMICKRCSAPQSISTPTPTRRCWLKMPSSVSPHCARWDCTTARSRCRWSRSAHAP